MKSFATSNNFATVLIIVTLLIFCIQNTIYAQTEETSDTIVAVSDRTTAVRDAIVAAVTGVTDAANVTNTQLAAITSLNLRNKSITALKSGDFSGMTGLTSLNLYNNQLSSLPDGIFKGLTALTSLRLGGNTTDPMQVGIYIEHTGGSNYKLVVPTGAPFDITVATEITDGVNPEGLGNQTVSKGNVESASFTAPTIPGFPVQIAGTLPSLPQNHYGYELAKIDPPSEETEEETTTENNAPIFTEGETATRSIAENTAAATNIGTPIAATDEDTDDSLTYTLGGTDAASFDIVSTSGQLQTKAALDYETKNAYSVSVTVSDGNNGSDTITVTINITDVTEEVTTDTQDENNVPSFTDGTITLRSIAENTAASTNIGSAVGATDIDEDDTLTYTLGGRDAASFAIDSATGQLKTKAALDYETKSVYLVSITVSDTTDTDTISVVISIIDVADTTISTTSLGVSDRTPQVRDAIVAAVPSVTDAADVTDAHLREIGSLDLRNEGIVALKTGDFSGLANLTTLNLYGNSLSTLPDGIFNGLTSLRSLRLGDNTVDPMPIFVSLEQVSSNQYRVVIPTGAPFDVAVQILLTDGVSRPEALGTLTVSKGTIRSATQTVPVISGTYIDIGSLPTLPTDHFGYTLSKSEACSVTKVVADAIAAAVPGVTDCRNVSVAQLAAITSLNLSNKSISSLQSSDFAGLLSLSTLNLQDNQLSTLPDGIFDGLTSLITLQLTGNTGAPFSFEVSLEKVGTNQFKAVFPIGAPFDIELPITVANGSEANNANSITIPKGSVESEALTVTRTALTVAAVTVDIGTLPSIPTSHNGYALSKSSDLPVTILEAVNVAPVFTEGTATTRSIPENTAAGTNIGTPVSATDGNTNDTLTYSLGGTNASSFNIVSTSGQLQTRATLDYETKNNYTVTVSVSDGNGGTDSIAVTINVTDVNENRAPSFTEGTSTTRSVAENTEAGENIGTPIAATDADNDELTYSLSGTNASDFDIVSTTGQLQTKSALDFESKKSYSVSVTVSDGNGGTDTIAVTINVTNVVNETSQQQVERSDNQQPTPVTTNRAPVFTEGNSTTRSVAENTARGTDIGTPIAATDADSTDTLTYSLAGQDSDAFSIVGTTGQLRTNAALDYETKTSYTVSVNVTDGNGGSDSISVTINVTDVANEGTEQTPVSTNNVPSFTDGDSTTRSIAENTVSGTNIGSAVSATDADTSNEIPDVLSYTLGGTDADAFSIDTTSGQLQTKDALDYETKNSYSVTVSVSDGKGGTDSITVTINVTDVNEVSGPNVAPVFTDGDSTYRLIDSQPNAGTNVGDPITATDANGDTLTYSLSGTHASRFNINSSTGQLTVKVGGIGFSYFDDAYRKSTVTVTVSDGKGGTDSIKVDVHLISIHGNHAYNNHTPFFSDVIEGEQFPEPLYTFIQIYDNVREFEIAENSSIGSLVASIHVADEDRSHQNRMRSSLSGPDANSFTVNDNSRIDFTPIFLGLPLAVYSITEISTNTTLDYETKDEYSLIVRVTDLEGATDTQTLRIKVTDVDEAPVFSDGSTTTRSIAENVSSGTSIGSAVTATDPEDDSLTYTLDGTDASSFSINSSTGQLTTSASLDYETKSIYTVTVTASDGTNSDSITVTINVTDLNEVATVNAPEFSEGTSTSRSVVENSASGTNIGNAVTATDDDPGTTLSYSLSGTDASSFSIVNSSGQLQTNASLDYESKSSYAVTITVSDGNLSDTIAVTINVTDANDAPVFDEGSSTRRAVGEEVDIGTNVGDPVRASDQDRDVLNYSLSGTDAASFTIDASTGQLKTAVELDYDSKSAYSVTVTTTDNDTETPLTDSITVIININQYVVESDPPQFTEKLTNLFANITRSVDENSASGTDIGSPVSATDPEEDELTYSLPGGSLDNGSFSVVSSTGQLQTDAALNHESQDSYRVFLSVTDGINRASTTVTINVNDVNDAPVFTDGTSKTLTVAENTAADTNIGSAIAATDEDENNEGNQKDTLTYSLSGPDAASFDVVSTSGQIKTKADLDYETKNSYSVTLSVSDGNQGTDSITVTINITDVTEQPNEPPVFTAGETATVSIAENVNIGTHVGSAFTATDADNDAITYSLSGTDADSFNVGSSDGQLETAVTFDYETKTSYTVIITASDGKPNNGKDTITVTINITDVTENNAPVFIDGDSTTRSVDEESYTTDSQSAPWVNIGDPITATDADNDTLTYAITGSPSGFQILSTGQLQGKGLDHETKASHSLTITVTDTNSTSDSITVTVNVNDINEKPLMASDVATTISVDSGTAASSNIGSVYTAYDYDDADTITFSLTGTDASSFTIDGSSTAAYTGSDGYSRVATGQIKNNSALDYNTQSSFSLNVVATDTNSLSHTTAITINVAETPDPVVSSRTQAVQDAIVAAVDGVSSASDITGKHLASITSLSITGQTNLSLSAGDFGQLRKLETLDLSNNGISSLPGTIFEDLDSLTSLDLSSNQIAGAKLPDGLFSGLSSLSTLDLSGNTGTPWVELSLEKVDHAENGKAKQRVRAKVNTAAPFDLSVIVQVGLLGAFVDAHQTAISAGSTYSEGFWVDNEAHQGVFLAITVQIKTESHPSLPSGHSGYVFRNSDDQPLEALAFALQAPAQQGIADQQLPETTALLPNFPNPFNPETWIPYQLSQPGDVSITVYDIRGTVVRTLDIGHQKAGFYTDRSRAAHWDGRNTTGERVANGVYFYQLKAGNQSYLRKMLILK